MTPYNSGLPNIHTPTGQTQTAPALPQTATTLLNAAALTATAETAVATLPLPPTPLRAGYNSLVPDIGLYRHLSHTAVTVKKQPKQSAGRNWNLLELLISLTGRLRAHQQHSNNKKIKKQDAVTEHLVITQPNSAPLINNKPALTGVSAQKNGVIRHER